MKVAFVADTHFGYPRFEEDASRQGAEAILDAAARADILVLGGDIFDTRVPRLETLAEVAGILAQAEKLLRENEKARGKIEGEGLIFGIHGTHERRGKDMLNPIQMLAKLGFLADVHNRTAQVVRGADRIAISGMGGVPDDLVGEALTRLACKPIDGAVNFFIFHQTMHEFVPQAPNLASIDELPKGYGYYLCGHIHKRAEFLGGRLLIPGSTVITQLRDEEGGAKGYYIIDTTEKKSEWIGIKCRHLEVIALEFAGQQPSEARKAIEGKLAEIAAKKITPMPIVRVRIGGKLAQGAGSLDLAGLERDDMMAYFDNSMEGGDIAAEMDRLRQERANKATPAEIGREYLAKNALKAGISAQRADELFLLYSEEK